MLSLEEVKARKTFCSSSGKWVRPCMWCYLDFPFEHGKRYCSQQCKLAGAKHKSSIHAKKREESIEKEAEKESKSTQKTCTCCKKTKPVSEFYRKGIYQKTKKPRYRSHCKSCCSLKAATKWTDNHEFRESRKNVGYKYSLRKNYGITEADYMEMYLKQDGVCAICKKSSKLKSSRLAVDHCHKTGKVRGLLCGQCNAGMGFLQDDIELLCRAIEYLKES